MPVIYHLCASHTKKHFRAKNINVTLTDIIKKTVHIAMHIFNTGRKKKRLKIEKSRNLEKRERSWKSGKILKTIKNLENLENLKISKNSDFSKQFRFLCEYFSIFLLLFCFFNFDFEKKKTF